MSFQEISHRRDRRVRREYLIFFSAFSAISAVNFYVSFLIRLDARGQRRRLYETTPEWHVFLMIRPAALATGSRAEQRTAEYRITNFESQSMESLRSIFL